MLDQLITQTSLIGRGWTKALVNKYYPKPSQLRNNPIGKSLAKVKLYDLNIIIKIEQTESFKNDLSKAKKRSASMLAVSMQKRADLLKQIDNMSITVEYLKTDKLVKKSIKHYNDFQKYNGNFNSDLASNKSDSKFLKRIVINYIRHELTRYDKAIDALLGKVGKKEAFIRLNQRIYQKIADIYPDYAEESLRQLQEKKKRIDYLIAQGGEDAIKITKI